MCLFVEEMFIGGSSEYCWQMRILLVAMSFGVKKEYWWQTWLLLRDKMLFGRYNYGR